MSNGRIARYAGLGGVAVALVLVLAWALWPDESGERTRADVATLGSPARTTGDPPNRPAPALSPKSSARADARPIPREANRAKRDALRAEILAAEAARPASPRPEPARNEDDPPSAGELTDRIGGREALLAELNRDFMPLADECIEQARERAPELAGMLALGIETVADEQLGAIVEAVEIQPSNEVADPELHECLSQTALSLMLPPPPEGGREQFMLTIPIEAE